MAELFSRFRNQSSASRFAHVSLYQRGDRMLICPDDQTEAGFWIGTDRIAVLPADVSAAELGAAVHQALADSRNGVPIPEVSGKLPLDAPLWRALGVRSRRAFMNGTRLCSILRDGSVITISPTANGGTSGEDRGWSDLAEQSTVLSDAADASELGAAIHKALEQSSDREC
jgi:hypothetical protein